MVSRVIAAIKAPKLSTYTGYYSCYLYTTIRAAECEIVAQSSDVA